MTVEDLTTFLTASAPLTAVIGGRVYPQLLPQHATLPAIVYSQIHSDSPNTLDKATGFLIDSFQFACMGKTYFDAKTTARTLSDLLDGFAGTMGSSTMQGCFKTSERDSYDNETLQFRTDLDFKFCHREV